MLKTLMKSIREYKKYAILTPVLIIGEVLLECMIPFLMSYLLEELYAPKVERIVIFSVSLVLMALVSLFFGALAGKTASIAATGFAKNLRKDMYYKVQDFSFENIDNFQTSSLVTRMTTDVTNVQMSFMMIIRTAVRAPLMMIFSIIMAFIKGPEVAWVFVVIAPILAIVLFVLIRIVTKLFVIVFKKYDKLNNSIQENIQGIRVVKSYVREEYETEKLKKASGELMRGFLKPERIISFSAPIMQFFMNTSTVVICALASIVIMKNSEYNAITGEFIFKSLSTGDLSSLLSYGVQILMSLMMVSFLFVMISMSIESAKRIVEVLKEESTIKNPENPVYEINDGSVEFKNVSFKYNKDALKYALENVNLKIESGMTVGILGSTGSSKTTLIQLISRLYDTTLGEVLVGGRNVKEYDLHALRREVSVVLQKNVLFSGTIKDNIKWGKKDATDEEIKSVCKLAQASEFIDKFPDGYDTFIERGGTNVSGGQRQRLCIARALIAKPKILILDDSTSAVDTKTDALIRKAFKEEIPNTTKIIIAQRVSSIQDSDMIIVLDNGSINQIGTHDELLKTNEIYKEIYETQNKVGGNENE